MKKKTIKKLLIDELKNFEAIENSKDWIPYNHVNVLYSFNVVVVVCNMIWCNSFPISMLFKKV